MLTRRMRRSFKQLSAQMYIRLHCLRKKPNLKQYRMYGEIWLFNISWFSDFHS